MFKLALTAGHYINTPGKRCLKSIDPKETREWTLNARIAEKVQTLLAEYDGIEILRTDDRTGKSNITLQQRTDKANKWGADFYLSIHHNAGIEGGSGGGIVAYVYTKASANSKEWQKLLYNSLIKHTNLKGNRSTPLATANLAECRDTKMPAVLLELGFMDSTTDTPIILTDDFAEKCAKACVEVIVAKGNLKKTAKPTETAKPTTPAKKSVTKVAEDVIAGKYGNGDERKKKLVAEGYNFAEVQAEVNRILTGGKKEPSFEPYLARVTASSLNIRKGAGTNYAVVGRISDKGTYTIVAESTGKGSNKGWGKLKSGAGWISLDYCKKV